MRLMDLKKYSQVAQMSSSHADGETSSHADGEEEEQEHINLDQHINQEQGKMPSAWLEDSFVLLVNISLGPLTAFSSKVFFTL